jgi:hypothetical protein
MGVEPLCSVDVVQTRLPLALAALASRLLAQGPRCLEVLGAWLTRSDARDAGHQGYCPPREGGRGGEGEPASTRESSRGARELDDLSAVAPAAVNRLLFAGIGRFALLARVDSVVQRVGLRMELADVDPVGFEVAPALFGAEASKVLSSGDGL